MKVSWLLKVRCPDFRGCKVRKHGVWGSSKRCPVYRGVLISGVRIREAPLYILITSLTSPASVAVSQVIIIVYYALLFLFAKSSALQHSFYLLCIIIVMSSPDILGTEEESILFIEVSSFQGL